MDEKEKKYLKIIRLTILFFVTALVLSGITAFPVEAELRILCNLLQIDTALTPETYTGMHLWIAKVYNALATTNQQFPFLAYGYDWLAFAHLVIGVAFIGLYRQPVRNIWIVHFAMIACVGVLPIAFICGPIREIPFYWQLIDCSFGIFGLIPLYFLRTYIKKLEALTGSYTGKY